ncbi:RNA-binding protein [Perilla frutescens var. frutescens]|nr:RNA-binding protein [Perilla frutescens var. frutescens]
MDHIDGKIQMVHSRIHLTESHFPPPPDQTLPSVLSDDLRRKIIKQVEYYFSNENLPNDKFLLKYVTRNAEGFDTCPLRLLLEASFLFTYLDEELRRSNWEEKLAFLRCLKV